MSPCFLDSLFIFNMLIFLVFLYSFLGFSGGASDKDPPANAEDARDMGWIRKFPGVGNGTPLQFSCLQNTMGRRS